MQAYKLKGKVNGDGKLIIIEPANLTPGDVEVIILQSETVTEDNQQYSKHKTSERPCKVKAFQNWFTKIQPAMSELNPDDAKWHYLKEKHNL